LVNIILQESSTGTTAISLVKISCDYIVFQSALFSLYPPQDEDEIIEKRIPADVPSEHVVHRILVKCIQLK
jgi:hypothetical protein